MIGMNCIMFCIIAVCESTGWFGSRIGMDILLCRNWKNADNTGQMYKGSGAAMVQDKPEGRVQPDEHGDLHESREAARGRVHPILVVDLHRLFLLLCPIFGVFLLHL